MSTLTVSTTLSTILCTECGVLFALTDEFIAARRDDHKTFYCPNGHERYYPGKTRAEQEKERADLLERRLNSARTSLTHTRDQLEATERSLSATKGVVTKMKKRVVAGTCPAGCRRHFADLQAHIETKHPDFAEEHHDH